MYEVQDHIMRKKPLIQGGSAEILPLDRPLDLQPHLLRPGNINFSEIQRHHPARVIGWVIIETSRLTDPQVVGFSIFPRM